MKHVKVEEFETVARIAHDSISKMMLDAADLIEEKGHCKKMLMDYDGRHCIIGAMLAVNKNGDVDQASTRICDVMGIEIGKSRWESHEAWSSVVDWNNAEDRTQEEVVAALRKAATAN